MESGHDQRTEGAATVLEEHLLRAQRTQNERRREAIARHEREGPMMAVLVRADGQLARPGDEDRMYTYVSYYVFADGATIEPFPGADVQEPAEPPAGFYTPGGAPVNYDWDADERYKRTLRNRLLYWRTRLAKVERDFESEQTHFMRAIPTRGAVERMEELVRDAMKCRSMIQHVERELHPPQYVPVPRQLTAEEQRALAEREREDQMFRQRISALTIPGAIQ